MSDKIKWAVQALAQPAEIQIGLFPDFVNVADELALTWEEALGEITENDNFSDDILMNIHSLDESILAISGDSNSEFWTDDALRESNKWEEVRSIAATIIKKMSWPTSSPGEAEGVYVGPSM